MCAKPQIHHASQPAQREERELDHRALPADRREVAGVADRRTATERIGPRLGPRARARRNGPAASRPARRPARACLRSRRAPRRRLRRSQNRSLSIGRAEPALGPLGRSTPRASGRRVRRRLPPPRAPLRPRCVARRARRRVVALRDRGAEPHLDAELLERRAAYADCGSWNAASNRGPASTIRSSPRAGSMRRKSFASV